jgi:hypothetical protein
MGMIMGCGKSGKAPLYQPLFTGMPLRDMNCGWFTTKLFPFSISVPNTPN